VRSNENLIQQSVLLLNINDIISPPGIPSGESNPATDPPSSGTILGSSPEVIAYPILGKKIEDKEIAREWCRANFILDAKMFNL
jgi:hypothetical protein